MTTSLENDTLAFMREIGLDKFKQSAESTGKQSKSTAGATKSKGVDKKDQNSTKD